MIAGNENRPESLVAEHPDWFRYDGMYFSLTDKAPPEASEVLKQINDSLDEGLDVLPPFNIAEELKKARIK